jgi:hypothetical protein
MKTLQYNKLKSLLLLILVSAFGSFAMAQDENKDRSGQDVEVKALVDAKRFTFKAQSVHPQRGRIVQLNSEYDLKVSGDTVRSYLPYFGRAYSAPIDGRGGGIDFTSKDFEYSEKARRKGGWDITIKPKDVSDVREMNLVVFENGKASLRVTSNNREPISYNGYVAAK